LFNTKSLHAQAEPLFRRALAINEARFGPAHPHGAAYLNNLAELLLATNRLAEAEPLNRRALAIFETSFGPAHPYVARGLSNLAQLVKDINRMAEAEPLYRRALASTRRASGRPIPMSRGTSTTSPYCCKTPTGSPRPNR
jgi:tetratricopeptide (TPR) repeat protein